MVVSSTIMLIMGVALFAVFYRTGKNGKTPTMGILALLLLLNAIGFINIFTENNYTLVCIVFTATIFFAAKQPLLKIIGFFGAIGTFAYPIIQNATFGHSLIGLLLGFFIAVTFFYPMFFLRRKNKDLSEDLRMGSPHLRYDPKTSLLEKALANRLVIAKDDP